MKNRKKPDLVVMPGSPFFQPKSENPIDLTSFIEGELLEHISEVVANELDATFSATGEPITAIISLVHHVLEAAEIAEAVAGITGKKPLIIQSQKEIEDESE